MASGPLTAFMPQEENTQIQSGFMPQDALSAPSNAEQLDRLRNKVAPDEEGSSLSLIKQAKDRLLAQSTGVDPLISWLAAYGSADPRNKLGAAAQAMTQAVGQQAASKQKLDLDVLQLDMAAAGKREAIAADVEKARLARDAKEPKSPDLYYKVGPDGKQYGPFNVNDPEEYKIFSQTPGKAFKVGTEPAPEKQNSGNDYGQGIVFRLSDGQKVQTRFNKESGYEYLNKDNKYVPIPFDAKPTTAGSGNPLDIKSFTTMRKDLYAENQGLKRLDDYMSTVGTSDQGYALMVDKVFANMNTFFKNDLSDEQFATIKGSAQLQALLGLNREDIVGPGVMTEYDAQRILTALGGDVSSLRNKEVVKSVLKEMFESKRGRAEILKDSLVLSAPVYDMDPKEFQIYEPKVIGKEEKERIAASSNEDKSRDGARKAIAANPSAKPQILQKLRDAGISVEGL